MTKQKIAPNLYLVTRSNGERFYIARFKRQNRQIERSLGNVKDTSLRDAKLQLAHLLMVVDELQLEAPVKVERKLPKPPTFAESLKPAIDDIERVKQWKNDRSRLQWEQSLKDYALPILGDLTFDKITREDILNVLKPIWFTKNETATRVRMRIEAIIGWAIRRGLRKEANPATWKENLAYDLPAKGKVVKVRHHESMTVDEAQTAVAYCLSHPSPVSAAILFGIATATRVSEFRNATREEIDMDNLVWLMPAERRKDGKDYPHRVPLSPLAIKAIRMAAKEGPLFVYNERKIALDSPRLKLIDILGRAVTMHGCRSTFRDWCAVNGVDHALAEKALSHAWGNRVTEAYLREDLLEARRAVMDKWSDVLMEKSTSVVGRKGRS